MKINILHLLIIIVFITGCRSVSQEKICLAVNEENRTSGITEKQAAKIARDYCMLTEQCYKYCMISSLTVGENEKWFPRQWIVSFKSKQLSTLDHSLFIHIDKSSGMILRVDWDK